MRHRPLTILHLAAEYNETRVHGREVDMNEMVRLFEANQWFDNPRYLSRTVTQVRVMNALMGGASRPPNRYFDDVSRIPAGGRHTPKAEYFARVTRSVEHHCALFERLEPDGVVIAGGDALQAFLALVVPALAKPPCVVVGMRNPGDEGHYGSWEDGWLNRYEEAEQSFAGTARCDSARPAVFKLVSSHVSRPFRLDRVLQKRRT